MNTDLTDIQYFEYKGYIFAPSKKTKFGKLPFGYVNTDKDNPYFVPNPEVLPLLVQAFEFLNNGGSLRDASRWLTKESGINISHQGFSNLWKNYHPDTNPRKERIKAAQPRRTKEDKERVKRNLARANAKKKITAAQKRIAKITAEEQAAYTSPVEPADTSNFATNTADEESIPEELNIVFRPNPGPQTDFLSSSETEVLYGGAAGGGKSYALLADPIRYFDNKNFRGLLIRRTNDELRELKWKSRELYKSIYPKAVFREKDSLWKFPSGAELWMSYLERDEDVMRYQGQAFSWIGVDELTQYPTPFSWNYLRSRLRTTDPSLPLSMRGTTNPGGPGHGWVKRMFVDPAPANTTFPAVDIDTGKPLIYPEGHAKEGQPLFHRRFIPASLYDNPYLTQDSNYEASLLSMPEQQRRQLLEGDWTVADGAAFPEFRSSVHVVEPYEIPNSWRKFRCCDYGYSSASAVHWIAIDPAFNTLVVYRELYVSKHTGRDLARRILELEAGESISYGVLDSSVWHQRGHIGPSIAEEMIAEGCRWRPSDRSAGSRVAGKNRLHELLKVDEDTGIPGIVFFNNCRQIISDLQVIPISPKGNDDIDDRYATDHAYDSIRYGIMSRPQPKTMFELTGFSPNPWNPSDAKFGY